MGTYESYYPDFNVMDHKGHWDDHTREIVEKRLAEGQTSYKSLDEREAWTLGQLISVLLDEKRDGLVHYVVCHFDRKLSSNIGEGQRKKGIAPFSVLIKEGLRNLFPEGEQVTKDKVGDMVVDKNVFSCGSYSVPIKEFMARVMEETMAAYYSHPQVWSEIGYAGPAYPRGYVRTEWGLTDPWEARR